MKIEIGDKQYEIKPLTLEQYDLVKESENIGDVELIHFLCGAPLKDIKKAPFADIKFVAGFLRSEALLLEDSGELEMVIEIDGVKYGLIEPAKISYEEWINLEVFMSQKPLNLPVLASHLYKPLKSENVSPEGFVETIDYDLRECQGRADLFKKKMKLKDFISSLFFLTTFAQELTNNTLSSLENKIKTQREEIQTMLLHQRKSPKVS